MTIDYDKYCADRLAKWKVDYPLFYVETKEEVDAILEDPTWRDWHLTVEHPGGNYCHMTAAQYVFRFNGKLGDYIISKGGALGNRCTPANFAFEVSYPAMARLVLEDRWNRADTVQKKINVLNRILQETCECQNRYYFDWAMTKLTEAGIPFTKLDVYQFLTLIAQYGWDEVLDHPIFLDMSYVTEKQRNELCNLALGKGYPEVATVFSTTLAQEKAIAALSCALAKADAPAPTPMNVLHANAHGGKDNEAIYQREYARGVAYALYMMSQKNCNFSQIIENLANHRRRMAALGNLEAQKDFGKKAQVPTLTKFEGPYEEFRSIVQEKYQNKAVQAKKYIKDRLVGLTQIQPVGWIIPPDDNDLVLYESARITSILHSQKLTAHQEEVFFGKLIWIMAHARYTRGNPTILYMLVDALCKHRGREPISHKLEGKDLNCMALCFDQQDDFVAWFIERVVTTL